MIISEEKLREIIYKAWRIGHDAPRNENMAGVDLVRRLQSLVDENAGKVGSTYCKLEDLQKMSESAFFTIDAYRDEQDYVEEGEIKFTIYLEPAA